MSALREPASFRDPSGHVYHLNGQVYRTVTETAKEDYEFARNQKILTRLSEKGWLIDSEEVHPIPADLDGDSIRYVLRHPSLPFISYPYEWCFAALKAAALLHLDLHLDLLSQGAELSDASAYNLQFLGPSPLFIDVLSIRRYREGGYWTGHRQFCEQFLNPLLIRAATGASHNAWFRGNLEGIPTMDLSRLLPFRKKLSWNVLSHVTLQARLEQKAIDDPQKSVESIRKKRFTLTAYRGMLRQLRSWISGLEPASTPKTTWEDYHTFHRYASADEAAKRAFVAEFVSMASPNLLWDLGCNVGYYSKIALDAGAKMVIGFDNDFHALEVAFNQAKSQNLAFLPLFQDTSNPSPDQGWRQCERSGFARRAKADALLALAFAHHLAIARNVPLPEVISWLISLAPLGVIEFVPKTDPTIRQMLALRDDVFANYSEEVLLTSIKKQAKLLRSERLSESGRLLCSYDSRP